MAFESSPRSKYTRNHLTSGAIRFAIKQYQQAKITDRNNNNNGNNDKKSWDGFNQSGYAAIPLSNFTNSNGFNSASFPPVNAVSNGNNAATSNKFQGRIAIKPSRLPTSYNTKGEEAGFATKNKRQSNNNKDIKLSQPSSVSVSLSLNGGHFGIKNDHKTISQNSQQNSQQTKSLAQPEKNNKDLQRPFHLVNEASAFPPSNKGKIKRGGLAVTLSDFWRANTTLSLPSNYYNPDTIGESLVCRGQTAIDWEVEFTKQRLHLPRNETLPADFNTTQTAIANLQNSAAKFKNNLTKTNSHMVVQNTGSSSSPTPPDRGSTSTANKQIKTERSERIRKRLLRQLRRREHARKFIAEQLAAAAAASQQEIGGNSTNNNDDVDSASVVSSNNKTNSANSSNREQETDAGIDLNEGGGKLERNVTFVSELSFVFPTSLVEDEIGDDETFTTTMTATTYLPPIAAGSNKKITVPIGSTSSQPPTPPEIVDKLPKILVPPNNSNASPQENNIVTAITLDPQQEASTSPQPTAIIDVTISNSNNAGQIIIVEQVITDGDKNVNNEAASTDQTEGNRIYSSAPGTENGESMPSQLSKANSSSNLLSVDDISAITSSGEPTSSAPEVCTVCGTLLTSSPGVNSGTGKRSGVNSRRNFGIASSSNNNNTRTGNSYYGSGTGISSKSALVNWFATRMTSDQMLMVASFEDDFAFTTPRQSVTNIAQSAPQNAPCGWLPNPKVTTTGYSSAPMKRRSTVSQQQPVAANFMQQHIRNGNFFGYHDSRRKLPTTGTFKHYERAEEHARFYRLQFTVGDAGRYAEMWRASIDPSKSLSDPSKPVDEMLLYPPSFSRSFVLNSTCGDTSNSGEQSGANKNAQRHHLKHGISSKDQNNQPGESAPSPGESENGADNSNSNSSNNSSGNANNSKTRQPAITSDAVAVGSGPVLVWSPHQHPTPVVTVSNATSQQVAAPPGPWPIRPWTLAQLEGKKVLNTKVSILTNSIKQTETDSPTLNSALPLALQPLQQSNSNANSNGGSGNGSQPGSGNSVDKQAASNQQALPINNSTIQPIKATSTTIKPTTLNNIKSSYDVQLSMREDPASLVLTVNNKATGVDRHLAGRNIEKVYRRTKLTLPIPNMVPTSAADVSAVVKTIFNRTAMNNGESTENNSTISSSNSTVVISNNSQTQHRHHRRRNSRVKLVPIDQAEIISSNNSNEVEVNDFRRSSLLSLTVRPRTSSMPKAGASNPAQILSANLANLLPFSNNGNQPSALSSLSMKLMIENAGVSTITTTNNQAAKSSLINFLNIQSSTNAVPAVFISPRNNNDQTNSKNAPSSSSSMHFSAADVLTQIEEDEAASAGKFVTIPSAPSAIMGEKQAGSSSNVNNFINTPAMKHDISPRPKLLVNNSTGS